MARPPSRQKSPLSLVIIGMRRELQMTQSELAQELGVSLPTVGKWESWNPPQTHESFARLGLFAKEKGLTDAYTAFKNAFDNPGRRPRTWIADSDEESHYVEAVLMALRQERFKELRVPLYRLLEPVMDAADKERLELAASAEMQLNALAEGGRTRARRSRRRVGRSRRVGRKPRV